MDSQSILQSPCLPLVLLLTLEFSSRIGVVKAMGVLFADLSNSIPMNSSDFGVLLGLVYAVGIFANPIATALYSRFTRPRLLLVVGATMGNTAILLAALATRSIQLYIIFAISGIGHTFVKVIGGTELARLAGESFNLLYSLASCGYSLGIVLFPYLAEELLYAYGWRGVLLIIGGLLLNSVPCAMALRITPEDSSTLDDVGLRRTVDASHSGTCEGVFEEQCGDSCSVAATDIVPDDAVIGTDKTPLLEHATEEGELLTDSEQSSSINEVVNNSLNFLTNIPRKFSSWFQGTNFYTDPISTFIFLSDIILYITYSGWHIFLVPHAIQRGMSPRNVIIITIVAAIGNLAIRLIIAFLTNGLVNPMNMHLCLTVVNVISLACDAFIPNFYVMLITSFLSAAAIAGRALLCPLVIKGRVSSNHFPTAFCFYFFFGDGAVLLGGYISGLIADMFSSYDATFKLLAVIDILTFFFMLVPRIVKRPDSSN